MSDPKTTNVMGRRVLPMPDTASAEAMSAAIAAMRSAMERLVALADAKLIAIRRADAQALLKVAAEEGPALEALLSAEQKRRDATAAIARQSGFSTAPRNARGALRIGGSPAAAASAKSPAQAQALQRNNLDSGTVRLDGGKRTKSLPASSNVNLKAAAHSARPAKDQPAAEATAAALGELRVTEVAAFLPQPMASQVGAAAIRLKGLGEELKRKNALVRDVTQGLQAHIRGIFASLAREGEESISYGPNGRESRNRVRTWVDAVG
ncbi:MAG: hypothetical protein SF069_04890 [Phycisphaerae bacterium]|nr:hypothetical protein [Phycisphaerae bacterium]